MCELLVGLPAVTVLGIDDEPGEPLAVHLETKTQRPPVSHLPVLRHSKGPAPPAHACYTEWDEGRIDGHG
jgi:hypothetical protein